MSRCDAQEFVKNTAEDATILGLDVGSKTIGLSIGSFLLNIATPLETIRRTKFKRDSDALSSIISEYGISGLVVGYPLEMSGEEGRRCQSIRDFMAELENHIKCPDYTYQDERLSTSAVDNYLDDFVTKRKTLVSKRKAKERGLTDKLAAQIILQDFFDEHTSY